MIAHARAITARTITARALRKRFTNAQTLAGEGHGAARIFNLLFAQLKPATQMWRRH